MKKIIVATMILSLSAVSFAKRPRPGKPRPPVQKTETPYTLHGAKGECTLTVHEIGQEESFVTRPRTGDAFFADVSASTVPGVIFHMKWQRSKRLYVGYDGNTGLRLVLRGAGPGAITPLSRGIYRVYEGKELESNCFALRLKR